MHAVSSTTTTATTATTTGMPASSHTTSAKPQSRANTGPHLHTRSATIASLFNPSRGDASPLAQAISRRDTTWVRLLLQQQADPATTAGFNAAHLAAASGHADALPLLQTAGEDMHAATTAGDTPLLLAARNGHAEAVRFLARSADLYHANKGGDSALTLAAAAGHSAIVRRLLVKGANVDHVNTRLDNALMAACRAGHLDVILMLLASGACLRQKNIEKETALALATASGATAAVDLLKAKGVTDQPGAGCAALVNTLDEWVARDELLPKKDQKGYVRWGGLSEDPDQSGDNGVTMLMVLTRIPWLRDQLKLLLRHGADLERADNEGYTALMHAAMFNQAENVGILRAAGARLDRRGQHGTSALHLAMLYGGCVNGRLDTVRLLLDKGAEIDARAYDGCTALHIAAARGLMATVALLLKCGASLCTSASGETALICAAYFDHMQVVKYLLDRGVDPHQTNNAGDNALDVALSRGYKPTAALLRTRGVKPAKR